MADFVTYLLLRGIQIAILVFAVVVFVNGFFQ